MDSGRIIDHGPLMGWARGTQALAAIWDQPLPRRGPPCRGRSGSYAGRARHGAAARRSRPGAGRTWGRGRGRAAMTAAEKARRTGAARDELHDGVGGEFAFDDGEALGTTRR